MRTARLSIRLPKALSAGLSAGLCAAALVAPVSAAPAPATPAPAASAASAANEAARLALGQQVFVRWCVQCHGVGEQYPGTNALAAKYKGAMPAVLEERTNLSPDFTKYFVRHGISVMPFFRKTEISDRELDALAAYLDKTPK